MAAPIAPHRHPIAEVSAGTFSERGHTVVETSLAAASGVDGVPGEAVLVADLGLAECVLDDVADPAEMVPGVDCLSASGWDVTVLVPARRMGAAHWGLRGTAARLQAWWPGPADSIQFGEPQVP